MRRGGRGSGKKILLEQAARGYLAGLRGEPLPENPCDLGREVCSHGFRMFIGGIEIKGFSSLAEVVFVSCDGEGADSNPAR